MVTDLVLQDSRATLKAVFQATDVASCPQSFNFHMHTVCSDGRLQPQALIQQAIALGLKGLAVTDHHTVRGFQAAQTWLQHQVHPADSPVPVLWSGVEITSLLQGTEVHILGYAFDPSHPAICPYLKGQAPLGAAAEAAQVIAAIQQAGGLAVLAHPARYRRTPAELIPAAADAGIDGIETYYCYTNPPVWQPSPRQTQQVWDLGDRYGLLHTCGTDTHGTNLLQRL